MAPAASSRRIEASESCGQCLTRQRCALLRRASSLYAMATPPHPCTHHRDTSRGLLCLLADIALFLPQPVSVLVSRSEPLLVGSGLDTVLSNILGAVLAADGTR